MDNPAALKKAHQCITATYNYSFNEANHYQTQLAIAYPEHPAPIFLKALIIYWENYPLIPENPNSEEFIELMNRVIDKAQTQMESDSLYMEGLFFDLFGRAFKAMFWADNGKPGKLIPDMRTMYAHTIEGFDYKDEFVEFYFSCGLYNYYIEAYAELHPVYKPVIAFMRAGDLNLGLAQLKYAIDTTTFLKAEALMFMSLIQLNYEMDLEKASHYSKQLFNAYPKNIYYRALYIVILLYQENFEELRGMLDERLPKNDAYSLMINLLAEAFIEEHTSKEFNSAKKQYNKCIELSDIYGEYGKLYKAIAYMGLSRISEQEGNEALYKKYLRLARKNTNYAYIISGAGNDPR